MDETERAANDCYRDARDYYTDVIGLARELGLNDEAVKLNDRLLHIKQVFHGQFAERRVCPQIEWSF
jgi:hypothetical protein